MSRNKLLVDGASQVLEEYLEASAKTTMDSLHAKLERFACEARARQIILPESVEPARYDQASLIFSCLQACFEQPEGRCCTPILQMPANLGAYDESREY